MIVIAGAGISGLAAAFELSRRGQAVRVFDPSPSPGGVIRSRQVDGYLFEEGPVAIEGPAPCFLELIETLGMEGRLLTSNPDQGVRYVYHHGHLYPMPTSLWQFLRTPLFSTAQKVRALAEPFMPQAKLQRDCSVAEFFGRRVGRAITSTWVDVVTSHIFAGHPNRLGIRGAFPQFFEAAERNRGVIRAFVKEHQSAENSGANSLYSLRGGLHTVATELQRQLGSQLVLGKRITAMRRNESGTLELSIEGEGEQESMTCDRLMIATPARTAGMLLAPILPTVADLLFEIESASLVTAALGAPTRELPGLPRGRDFHAARWTRLRTLGWTFTSNLFRDHAGEERVVMNGMIGGILDKPIVSQSDAVVRHLLLGELALCLGQRRMPHPDHLQLFRWPASIPQYQVGHQRRLEAVLELTRLEWPEVSLLGNYIEGTLIEDCLRRSRSVVAAQDGVPEPAA